MKIIKILVAGVSFASSIVASAEPIQTITASIFTNAISTYQDYDSQSGMMRYVFSATVGQNGIGGSVKLDRPDGSQIIKQNMGSFSLQIRLMSPDQQKSAVATLLAQCLAQAVTSKNQDIGTTAVGTFVITLRYPQGSMPDFNPREGIHSYYIFGGSSVGPVIDSIACSR